MNRILFVRHGATPGNREKRYIGRTDESLDELGVRQALAIWDRQLRPDHLFVSPARRAVQTAELAFPGAMYTLEPDLWETDFGLFEGKTADELAGDPQYRAWVDSGCTGPIPGGEDPAAFKARCAAAFRRCMASVPEEESAAFVIHGGCIMAILEALAQPQRDFYDYHLPNGGLSAWTWEEGVLTA